MLDLFFRQYDKLLVGRRVLDGDASFCKQLSQLHGFVDGVARYVEIEHVSEQRIKLDARQSAFGQQRSVLLDDVEEMPRCIVFGENNCFAAQCSNLLLAERIQVFNLFLAIDGS